MAELERVWPVITVYALFDVLQYVTSGGIRAAGKQGHAAVLTWVSYCGITFPLAWAAAFPLDLGLTGIWIGLTSAILLNFLGYVVIWSCMDWKSLIE